VDRRASVDSKTDASGEWKSEDGKWEEDGTPPTRVFSAKSPETLETKDVALRWGSKEVRKDLKTKELRGEGCLESGKVKMENGKKQGRV